jgi:haloacetate dehalogenase
LLIVGEKGGLAKCYDVPALWRERVEHMQHDALPAGHFLPEEMPEDVAKLLREFFLAP